MARQRKISRRSSGKEREYEDPSGSADQGAACGAEPAGTDQVAAVEAAPPQQCRSVEEGIAEVAAMERGEGEPRAAEVTADERDAFENGVSEIRVAKVDTIEAGVSERQRLKRSLLLQREQSLSQRSGGPSRGFWRSNRRSHDGQVCKIPAIRVRAATCSRIEPFATRWRRGRRIPRWKRDRRDRA